MAGPRKKDRSPTKADLAQARRTQVWVVFCKHLDPSLEGDGTDMASVMICTDPDRAREEAKKLQDADPDRWNAYGVTGPKDLLSAWKEGGMKIESLRAALEKIRTQVDGPIAL